MTDQHDMSGILFKNDKKTEDKHPDYTGTATIDGVRLHMSAWIKQGQKGKFMTFSFKQPREGCRRQHHRSFQPERPSPDRIARTEALRRSVMF